MPAAGQNGQTFQKDEALDNIFRILNLYVELHELSLDATLSMQLLTCMIIRIYNCDRKAVILSSENAKEQNRCDWLICK